MIKLKLKTLKGKLNKSGMTLIEVFFSFLILIAISVMVINSTAKRDLLFDDVKEYEMDHESSMRAVSKALLFSGVDDEYRIVLKDYIPLTNINARNELHLINTLEVTDGVAKFKDSSTQYEVFNRYQLGETVIETYRDKLIDDYRVSVSFDSHKHGKFEYQKVENLLVGKRGGISSPGVYYTMRGDLFNKKYEELNFNNILKPAKDDESEVLYYEETF